MCFKNEDHVVGRVNVSWMNFLTSDKVQHTRKLLPVLNTNIIKWLLFCYKFLEIPSMTSDLTFCSFILYNNCRSSTLLSYHGVLEVRFGCTWTHHVLEVRMMLLPGFIAQPLAFITFVLWPRTGLWPLSYTRTIFSLWSPLLLTFTAH